MYSTCTCTWCDALIGQAFADCQHVAIHMIECHENFAGETLIEPHYLAQHPPTTIYLRHLDELHYVSTAAVTCGSDALENQHSTYLSVRVVTHNPPRVVTPISPCDISVINKKAHGRKCWLCLWISSLFSHSRRGGNPGLKFYRRASNRRSTGQDVLFEQPQNSSPKRKHNAYMRKYRKRVKTSESLNAHYSATTLTKATRQNFLQI